MKIEDPRLIAHMEECGVDPSKITDPEVIADMSAALEQQTWNARLWRSGGDPDAGTAFMVIWVDAPNEDQAFLRALAYADRNFDDDSSGAKPTLYEQNGERYLVHLQLRRPR